MAIEEDIGLVVDALEDYPTGVLPIGAKRRPIPPGNIEIGAVYFL